MRYHGSFKDLHAIEFAELCFEMSHERSVGKRLSSHDFYKSLSGISLAMAMNLFVQPLLERPELALGEGGIQVS